MRKWLFLGLLCTILSVSATISAQTDDVTPIVPPPIVEPTMDPLAPSPTPAPLILDPLLGLETMPPLDITLPEGWQLALRDTYAYRDILPDEDLDGSLETLPIDVYVGPVTNGTGWIIMLWGYDSIVPFTPEFEDPIASRERANWLNGLRMLQFVVFDARCNIGTAPQRDYTIGRFDAVGTTFSAVDCPFEQPNTRGWFAAMNIDNLNFAFFAYADPIQPAGSIVEFELQAILDTVEFRVEDITVTAAEVEATRQAIALTPIPGAMGPTLPTATQSP